MYYYNTAVGKDLVTVDEILSMYLWNQKKAPTPEELNDSKWIRQPNTLGDSLEIDLVTYMQEGPGRFVSAADIPFLVDFFNHPDIAPRETPYSHEEIWQILRPKVEEVQELYNIDVYQYITGIGSHDYLTRAFIWGSTKFTVDLSKIKYKVNSNGKKEILDLIILPSFLVSHDEKHKENFDFVGAESQTYVKNFNKKYEPIVDPSGIGRKVLINFSGDVGAVDIDEETFRTLEAKRQEVVRSSLPDIKFNEAQLLLKAKNEIDRMINNSSAIQHKDSEGRLVYYAADTTGGLVGKKIHNDESGASFSGIGGFPHVVIGGKTYLNIVRPHEAVSLIGSNANDILVGGYEDDLLMGNDGEDTLDSGEGNDILKGGVGDDTLEGGEGDDTLEGGGGFDTYRADNGDTIIDSDGMGRVYLNGKLLTGGERNSKDSSIYKGSDGTTYIWGGDDLTVGGLTIKNFDGNGLGIKLADKNDKKPDVGAAEMLLSPLVIDMNGDGAKSVEQNRHHVYFDLDNNGFAERTGWADKDDALLVLDRNGNGTIDNGSELFGNYTTLKNGGYAENGFDALKDFDENQDNVLTRDDPIWSQLQLWRDANTNGITEVGELTLVSESMLASINLAYQNMVRFDRGYNVYKQKSDVTWRDNSQTEILDFWFDNDVGDSQAVAVDVEMTEEVADLPNISASGNVYNLHTAMLLNPKLKEKVQSYIAATPERRNELLDELIYTWTGADKHSAAPRGYIKDGRQLAALEALIGRPYYQNEFWGSSSGPDAAKILNAEYQKLRRYVSAQIAAQTDYKDIFDSVRLRYENSTQKVIYDWDKLHIHIMLLRNQGKTDESDTLIDIAQKLGTYSTELKVNYLSRPTRSENNVNIFESNNGIHDAMISTPNNDEFYGGWGNDAFILGESWGQDTVKLYHKDSEDVDTLYFTDINLMPESLVFRREKGNQLVIRQKGTENTVTVEEQFSEHPTLERIVLADGTVWNGEMINQMTVKGTEDDDAIIGVTDKDVIYAGEGNDVVKGSGKIYGENGNDRLSIVAVNSPPNEYMTNDDDEEIFEGSFLSGGAGDDVLETLFGSNTLLHEYDDDWNVVSSYREMSMAHVLEGGSGNDKLYGSYGDEIYHFDSGFGRDDIHNMNGYDVIRFGEGIAASDIGYYREGDNLLLKHINGEDQITVHKHFVEWEPQNKISTVQFVDGTTLNQQELEAKVVYQGSNDSGNLIGNESLTNMIHGGANDDYIAGGRSDDHLIGGEGKDTILGFGGNDRLEGGEGDDYLSGGDDSKVNSANDWLSGDNGNDVLFGSDGDDLLLGGAGDDYLAGGNETGMGSGHDILLGGTGEDTLWGEDSADYLAGGADNDCYLYRPNGGLDVIETGGGEDILFFKDIDSSRLSFHRDRDDLVMLVDNDSTQQVRVLKHFLGSEHQLGGVEPTDGYIWYGEITEKITPLPDMDAEVARQVNSLISAMSAFGGESVVSAVVSNSITELQDLNRYLTGNLA